MTTFPNSPKLIKGGIVLIDPQSAQVQRIISLQYNPESLEPHFASPGNRRRRRSLGSVAFERAGGGDDQARRRDRRHRSIGISRSESECCGARHPAATGAVGILVHPSSGQLNSNNQLAQSGRLGNRPDGSGAGAVCLEQATASCPCASPISASPKKRSIRRSIRSAPK